MKDKIVHPFKPIYNQKSSILILGTIASITSREKGYPYAHPQNRFWKIMSILFDEEINDYKYFLLNHNIALWDVIKSCDIKDSSDASIQNVEVNEIWEIIKKSNIKHIFTNGKKAHELYNKYIYPQTKIKAFSLSSTSPANATKSLNDLVLEYKIIKDYLK